MPLFVVNEHYTGTNLFRREVSGSKIIGQFHSFEECKTFTDKTQAENPDKFFFVNDVFNKKIAYRTEDGWML